MKQDEKNKLYLMNQKYLTIKNMHFFLLNFNSFSEFQTSFFLYLNMGQREDNKKTTSY
jgi:hypothetical protein